MSNIIQFPTKKVPEPEPVQPLIYTLIISLDTVNHDLAFHFEGVENTQEKRRAMRDILRTIIQQMANDDNVSIEDLKFETIL